LGIRIEAFNLPNWIGKAYTLTVIESPARPATIRGNDWSDAEVKAIVSDYMEMLDQELRGQTVNKTDHRRNLKAKLVGRSDGSIEFKHQNISAVLQKLKLPWITGYRPRLN
jgi:hypothetical protein